MVEYPPKYIIVERDLLVQARHIASNIQDADEEDMEELANKLVNLMNILLADPNKVYED